MSQSIICRTLVTIAMIVMKSCLLYTVRYLRLRLGRAHRGDPVSILSLRQGAAGATCGEAGTTTPACYSSVLHIAHLFLIEVFEGKDLI